MVPGKDIEALIALFGKWFPGKDIEALIALFGKWFLVKILKH